MLTYIIRDHDRDRFERRKKELEHLTRKINHEFPGCASIELKDQYYNMREKIEPVMHIIDIAVEAMKESAVTPKVQPIRGGTDGAQLSFKGLPLPQHLCRRPSTSTDVMSSCPFHQWKKLPKSSWP